MRLRTNGFKTHDLDIELAPNTLLVGPNASGKSTALDAVRFLGVGYVPALGKRPVDTADLMQNGVMSAELIIPDVGTVRRSIERSGSGFTVGADASWIRNAKPTEAGKQILRLFGAEELDVAEILDIRQLLNATPNQRAARIEQLLSTGQKSADETARDVARFIVMRLADSTPERMPEDYRQAAAMIPEKQLEVLSKQEAMMVAKIREAGLQGALTWSNEEKRRAADSSRSKQAAESQLRIRAAEVPEPSEIEIQRLENERGQLQQDLGVARERAAAAKRHEDAKKSAAQDLEATKVAHADAQTVRDGLVTRLEQLPKLREELKKVQTEIDTIGHEPPQQEEQTKAIELEKKAQALDAQADGLKLEEVPDTHELWGRSGALKGQLDSAELTGWPEVMKIGKRWAKTKDADQKKDGKTLVSLATKSLGEVDLDELRKEMAEASEKLNAAEEKKKRIQAANGELEARAAELRKHAKELRTESKKIRDDYKKSFEKIYIDWQEKVRKISRDKTWTADQVEQVEEQNRRTLGALERAAAAVKSAEKRIQDLAAIASTTEAGDIEGLAKKQTAIDDRLKTLKHAQSTHAEIRHILDSIAEAKAEHAVFSAIEWGLQQQRNKEISEAGGPLKQRMQEFLVAAGRKETPFIRAENGCNIGWKRLDGAEIKVQTLSGAEWCLFASALTLSVILCRDARLRILLVEAGEADVETLAQLLAGIRKVNDDLMGAFTAVVATPHASGFVPEGWTVVEVGQHATAGGA